MAETDYRALVWNSFLKLAWMQAKQVASDAHKKPNKDLTDGDWQVDAERKPLDESETRVLGLLLLGSSALEARANHLIETLRDEKILTEREAEAAKGLPLKHKWFLLPSLARSSKKIDGDRPPHKAVAELCKHRNNVVHAKFEELEKEEKGLPKPAEAIRLWCDLVDAFEDMNVILGRTGQPRLGIDDFKFQ